MAEKNENEVLIGADTSQENTTPVENLTAPGEQPQAETPGLDTDKQPENPALGIADTPPEVADGDVVIPSNVIDGLFEDRRAAAKEAEKKAAELGAGEKDAPAKKRVGRPPKADKQPQAEKRITVFHTPKLDWPDTPSELILSRETLYCYYEQVQKKILEYVNNLEDTALSKIPDGCKSTRLC